MVVEGYVENGMVTNDPDALQSTQKRFVMMAQELQSNYR